jgi:hypothetical protein
VTKREQASATNADLLEVNTLSQRAPTMTTLLLPSTDPRGPKAVELATDAGQWIKCRTADGRKAYGIRASKGDNYYLVTRTSCTCYDAQRHTCKHMLAVQLHCQHVADEQAAAKYDDIFARFDDDPAPLARILGKPRKGFEPIVRED